MEKVFSLKDFVAKNKETVCYQDKFAILDLSGASTGKRKYQQLNQPIAACCILMVTNGEVNVVVDHVPYCLKENMILMLQGRRVVDGFHASDDCEGHCLIFDDDYLEMLVHEEKPPRELMITVWLRPVIECNKEDFAVLQHVAARIYFNLRRTGHAFIAGMLTNELRSFHYEMWNCLARNNPVAANPVTPYEKTAIRFIRLLQKNFRAERAVARYASELCVSPVFLIRAMKKVTNKTAGQWIDEAVIAESKIRLRKPGASIKEIANDLNFSDQASFSKFYKKNTGLSPSAYKKKAAYKIL
jgi:AraC-like DNA-binding protein